MWVEINCQNPITIKGKLLGQMDRCCRLPCAPFEVGDRNDLDMLPIPTTRNDMLELGA